MRRVDIRREKVPGRAVPDSTQNLLRRQITRGPLPPSTTKEWGEGGRGPVDIRPVAHSGQERQRALPPGVPGQTVGRWERGIDKRRVGLTGGQHLPGGSAGEVGWCGRRTPDGAHS